jgi:pimeloyl-ACP methyl ester carboxylesterase
LAVLGELSPAFLQEGFHWLSAVIEQLETLELPGVTHLLQLEAPTPIVTALLEFLTRHPIE